MQIQLNAQSQFKLNEILDDLYTNYDFVELMPEDLIDALLDIGLDIIAEETVQTTITKSRLLEYCGKKITSR